MALVCKKLRTLCIESVLLHKLDFRAPRPETALPRIRSLLRFLRAHGQNLHELLIADIPLYSLTAAQAVEAASRLSTAWQPAAGQAPLLPACSWLTCRCLAWSAAGCPARAAAVMRGTAAVPASRPATPQLSH